MSDDDDLRRSIDHLRATMEQLIAKLVRQDVYDSDQRGVQHQIKTIDHKVTKVEDRQTKTEDQRAADRRLLIAAFVSPLLMLVIQLYLNSQGVA